jgi:hypothetical protein
MRRLFLLAIIVCQSFFLAANADAAERLALIIGNGDYQNAPRLPNPVNDATDVAAAFARLGFSVQLIKNGNFDVMRRALLTFAQQAPSADIAVVYFAGHGIEIRDENWLIPVDAELRMDVSAGQEAISLASVVPIASRAKRLGLIILDACRDNPFSRQIQMSQPGRALASRGFVPIEPPNSVLVAFAAKHGTTAADGVGQNSPYTAALLHNLETPGLEINYLFRNIHDEVYAATQRQQEPYVYGTLSKEPIYLRPALQSGPPEAKGSSDVAQAWAAVKDSPDPVDLETFLGHFGSDPFYSALARNRLNQLRSRLALSTPVPSTPAPPPITRTEQTAKLETPPAPEPNAVRSSDNAVLGHWAWRSQCPIFGSFHGDMTFAQSEKKGLTGVNTDTGKGERREIFDARFQDESVSFRIKVDGGATQHWRGNLGRGKNGQYLLQGTATDSRFSIRGCTWTATKDQT